MYFLNSHSLFLNDSEESKINCIFVNYIGCLGNIYIEIFTEIVIIRVYRRCINVAIFILRIPDFIPLPTAAIWQTCKNIAQKQPGAVMWQLVLGRRQLVTTITLNLYWCKYQRVLSFHLNYTSTKNHQEPMDLFLQTLADSFWPNAVFGSLTLNVSLHKTTQL